MCSSLHGYSAEQRIPRKPAALREPAVAAKPRKMKDSNPYTWKKKKRRQYLC